MTGRLYSEGDLYDEAARLIGSFVACVASFELELDDLVSLSGAQNSAIFAVLPKYPVQISGKLESLPKIAEVFGHNWNDDRFREDVTGVLDLRQMVVHGRISSVSSGRHSFFVTIEKMGLPNKREGAQYLERSTTTKSSEDFWFALEALGRIEQAVEELRVSVFTFREGWPTYMVGPTGKPFCAAKILRRRPKVNAGAIHEGN